MRVVTPRRLSEFALRYPSSRIPLLIWYEVVRTAKWESFNDIKQDFNSVDYVGNNRYVFNIKGSDFRIVVIIIFISKKVYVSFIGTHDEYSKINAKTI